MCVCARARARACVLHACMHTYIHAFIHALIHTHTHAYLHAQIGGGNAQGRLKAQGQGRCNQAAMTASAAYVYSVTCFNQRSSMLLTILTEKTGKDSLSVSLMRTSESPYIAVVRQRAPASTWRMCWSWWTACPCHSSALQRGWPWCRHFPLQEAGRVSSLLHCWDTHGVCAKALRSHKL